MTSVTGKREGRGCELEQQNLPVTSPLLSTYFVQTETLKSKRRKLVNSKKVGGGDFWITRVAQVVRAPDQCFESCELKAQNLSVSLPICLSASLSQTYMYVALV